MKKLTAILATAALALGLSIATATPANAVYGNYLVNSSNRCTDYVPDGWPATSTIRFCGAGNSARNVHYLRIPAGKCVEIGYWSFTRYCAPSGARNIYIGGGTTFVR